MFSGLSAFPLTPMKHDVVDEMAFIRLIERLTDAGVDSIGAWGRRGITPISPGRSGHASRNSR